MLKIILALVIFLLILFCLHFQTFSWNLFENVILFIIEFFFVKSKVLLSESNLEIVWLECYEN